MGLEENAYPVVGVAPVAVPADHVEVPRVAAVDSAQEVRPERQHVRTDAETRILEACLERLEGVLRVRQVGPRSREVVEVELDRKGESCLLQQAFCLARVVGVLHDVVRVAEQPRRHELVRDFAAPKVEGLHDRLPIETVSDRLPNRELVHRRLRLVEPDVGDVERRAVEDLEVRVVANRRDVLRRNEVVRLNLAGLESLESRGVVGDRPEDQLAHLRLGSPVARIADENDPLTKGPCLELEGTGTDRMLCRECPRRMENAVRINAALVGAVLHERRRTHDCEVAQGQRA